MKLRTFVAYICLILPGSVNAEFGLGPCCSGAPCGIIPCDSACAGRAFDSLGQEVSSEIGRISNSFEQITQSVSEVDSSGSKFYKDIGDQFASSHDDLTSGLEVLAIRKEVANNSVSQSIEASADTISAALADAFIKITNLQQITKYNELYGTRSQPDLVFSIGNKLVQSTEAQINKEVVESNILSIYLDYDELARSHSDNNREHQSKSLLLIQRKAHLDLFYKALNGHLSNDEALQLALQWTAMNDSDDLANGLAFSGLSHFIAQVSVETDENINLDSVLNGVSLLQNIEPGSVENVAMLNQVGLNRLLGLQNQIRSAQLQKLRKLSAKRQASLIGALKVQQND